MRVYFSTVTRRVPHELSGELVCMDWSNKSIVARRPMIPTDPNVNDGNPRGGARGGRGIVRVGDQLIAATYHTLHFFDAELNETGRISHDLFVGLHEVCSDGNGAIWVAATAIDAALNVDLTGDLLRSWWPREELRLQDALHLEPQQIDKTIDNRTLWLEQKHTKSSSHTHINAVRVRNDNVYVLLNRFGVVYDATDERFVVNDPTIEGAHNLETDGDCWVINDTRGKNVRVYDDHGREASRIKLLDFPDIRSLHDAAVDAEPKAQAVFVRGLHRMEANRYLVGFSPASIAEIDLATGELIDLYQHSNRARDCVHGLLAWH